MEIKTIVSEEMGQNCYLLKNGDKGILIDPGLDTFKILRETQGVEINYILLTHCHFDHTWSLNELRGSKKVVGSKNCDKNMVNPKISLSPPESLPAASLDIIMEDGEERDFDGIKIKCICTPGHTDCSVCYLAENSLFTGDTLFYQSVGRTDLATGSFAELENSIKNKLYKLDDIKAYPGHGPATSIAFERKNNSYITE